MSRGSIRAGRSRIDSGATAGTGGQAMRAQPKASHYVNGSFVDDPRGDRLAVTYPATGETIANLAATENIIAIAIEAAARRSLPGRG